MPGKLSTHVRGLTLRRPFREIVCVTTMSVAALAHAVVIPTIRVKIMEVDPAVSCLSTDELIDRLQEENQSKVAAAGSSDSQPSYNIITPAFEWQFLPIVEPAFYRRTRSRLQSPVMTELVKRGVAALPVLLQHLTDSRPTRIVEHGPDEGIVSFGDSYDPRYSDPRRQPKGINTVKSEGENSLSGHNSSYTFTVGDLCLRAVDNIVNRHQQPPGGMLFGNLTVICSPTRYPALAEAVRADWSGLTAQEHEQSLRFDALETSGTGRRGYHAMGALQRLRYYYPQAGRDVTEFLLRRELVANGSKFPREAGQVTCGDQWVLLDHELTAFHWDGLDQLIYEVFQKATRVHGENRMLPLTCAKRLAGRGHDREFKEFYSKLITENEAELANSALEKSQQNSLAQDNEAYRAFLKTIDNGA